MANIKLNNNSYPIPDSVLAGPTADFVAHLGAIAGDGLKVVVGGVEYGVDASKVAGAVAELGAALDGLNSGGGAVGCDTLTWDGNTTGLVNTNNVELPMYKVSDVIITKSDLTNGISFVANGEEQSIGWETLQSAVNDDDFGLLEAVAIVPYDNYNFVNGIVFPEAGVYFINIPNVVYCSSFTINGYTGFSSAPSPTQETLEGDGQVAL